MDTGFISFNDDKWQLTLAKNANNLLKWLIFLIIIEGTHEACNAVHHLFIWENEMQFDFGEKW